MTIHQRPRREEGEEFHPLPLEATVLMAQGTAQFEADALLNELAAVVRKAKLPWGNRMLLLHGIGMLRGYVHNQTRRMVAETQGRCN